MTLYNKKGERVMKLIVIPKKIKCGDKTIEVYEYLCTQVDRTKLENGKT